MKRDDLYCKWCVNANSFIPFPFLTCVNHGMDGEMLTILETHHKKFIAILTYSQHTNLMSICVKMIHLMCQDGASFPLISMDDHHNFLDHPSPFYCFLFLHVYFSIGGAYNHYGRHGILVTS